MDFERLMQQANANQLLTERRHERKQMQKDEEKRRIRELKLEKERKAVERLKCFQEASYKKQLEYKGLMSSQGLIDTRLGKGSPSESSSSSSSSGTKPSASHKETKKTTARDSTQSPARSVKKDIATKPPSQAKKPASKAGSSSLLPSKPKVQGTPMSFAALMKVAEKNQKDTLAAPSPSSSREPSPVGKPLSKRAPQHSTLHSDKSRSVTGAGKSTTKPPTNHPSTRPRTTTTSHKKPFSPTKTISDLELTRRTLKQAHASSKPTNGLSRTEPKPSKEVKPPSSSTRISPQAQAKGSQRMVSNPARTNSFYGAANAKLLNQDRRCLQTSLASRSGTVNKHTSGWVSEMATHLQEKMRNGYFEGAGEEEEDYYDSEEEGFVTSDDDFIDDGDGTEDYSATIREIFGYDKRRFANERFDSAAMESSYAQQEFEEKRSARIGRLEDEEDMRAEREQMMSRKRKMEAPRGGGGGRGRGRGGGGGGKLKQARLSFR